MRLITQVAVRTRRAFTLVELMIVLTVMAVMMSFAAPTFHKTIVQANADAAASEVLASVGSYPIRLLKQAEQAADVTVSLNFYGYLRALLMQINTDTSKDPKFAGLVKQLDGLRSVARKASDAKFAAWVETRRQADLVTRAEEENAVDPDEALFD